MPRIRRVSFRKAKQDIASAFDGWRGWSEARYVDYDEHAEERVGAFLEDVERERRLLDEVTAALERLVRSAESGAHQKLCVDIARATLSKMGRTP